MPQSFDPARFGAGYTYQSNFGSIGFGGKHYDTNYGIPGVPPNDDWANVPPSMSRIEQSRSTFELRSLLNGGGSFAKQWKVNASYNDYSHAEFPTAQDATGVFDERANHFHKKEFNGSLQIQHQPWGQFHGTIGVWADLEHLRIEGDQPLGPNSQTTGLAGYRFEEYMKWENTRLQGGLRYDYNHIKTKPDPNSTDSVFQTLDESRNANAVTASLGAVHTFRPGLVGSFSVARSFRAPTVQELFANGPDDPSGTFTSGPPI
jgi:iron complex outermembrane receptor protein